MRHTGGRVTEVRHEAGKLMEAFIACPVDFIPQPGQYLLASDPGDSETPLGTPLFLSEKSNRGFWAAPSIPYGWRPGTELDVVGPLGHGFALPRDVQRLALVVLGETAGRLVPLVNLADSNQRSMTMYTNLPLPLLPSSIEIYPLTSLVEALDWPDFMVIDLPLQRLPELRGLLGASAGTGLPFPAQVLITTPMPCAALARCGACAVPARRGWKLVCEDGPVFELDMLKW